MRNCNSDLGFHKTDALIKLAKAPARVSASADGNVAFGSKCMLVNPASNSALSSLPSVHVGVHEIVGDRLVYAADMHMSDMRSIWTVYIRVALRISLVEL